MSRFLVYAGSGSGHLFPLTATAEALRDRGHEVVLRADRPGVEILHGLGFPAEPIRQGVEERGANLPKTKTPLGGMRGAVALCMDGFEHEAADVRDAIEAERPDAIVVDNLYWGAAAAAEASGLPWAQAAVVPLPLVTPDAPPFGLGLRPARGIAGRARDAAITKGMLALFNRLVPTVNEGRTRLGVPPLEQLNQVSMNAPLVRYYVAEPLEYPRSELPPSIRTVGPAAWDPGTADPADAPSWLDEIEGPMVLVTASTHFQDDGNLIQTAIDALEDEPEVVVATTASMDPARFRAKGNARIERFVPPSLVLSRATCVVCHAGVGILSKSLMSGVPVCAVPFARDQFELARRVEVAGAGSRLLPAKLDPDRMREAVKQAIACREGAERAGRSLAAAGGAESAAETIEGLPQGHFGRKGDERAAMEARG